MIAYYFEFDLGVRQKAQPVSHILGYGHLTFGSDLHWYYSYW
jgi:hypothetical protein